MCLSESSSSIFLILTVMLLNCLFLFFFHLKLELLTQFPASNDEKYIGKKGIFPGLGQGKYPSHLCIFHHLKLELPAQFPASNDEKLFQSMKNRHVPYLII